MPLRRAGSCGSPNEPRAAPASLRDGLTVAAWGRDVLHQIDTVRGGLQALSARRSQGGIDLGVAASLTVAEFVLPRWIGELRASMPEVHLRLQVQNSDRVDDLVHSGDCALGFVESTRVSEDLARRVVGFDRLVIVVPASHPWARRSTPLSREQLLGAEFVVREEGSGTRSTFERALAAQPRIAMVAASTTAMVGAALAGVGAAVVTPYAVRAGLDTGELVEVQHELDLVAAAHRDLATRQAAGRRGCGAAEDRLPSGERHQAALSRLGQSGWALRPAAVTPATAAASSCRTCRPRPRPRRRALRWSRARGRRPARAPAHRRRGWPRRQTMAAARRVS